LGRNLKEEIKKREIEGRKYLKEGKK